MCDQLTIIVLYHYITLCVINKHTLEKLYYSFSVYVSNKSRIHKFTTKLDPILNEAVS